jgi:hypothetical protein
MATVVSLLEPHTSIDIGRNISLELYAYGPRNAVSRCITALRIVIHSPVRYVSFTSGTDSAAYLKGVVMRFRHSIVLMVTFLVMSTGLFCGAEAKTIEAGHGTVSWTGQGVIDDLGDGERIFRGMITGTIIVKHPPVGSALPQIHKGRMDCQAILHVSENQEGPKTGVCIIRAHEDKDLAYVEIRCVGMKGECKGEMTWAWGRGGFKGISGTTPFVSNIYIEQEKAGRIHGSAHWPEMTYTLP